MALSTPFTCPNGHAFTANAKLRTRCPECGAMARRTFETKNTPDPKTEPETPEVPPTPENPPKPPEPKKPVVKVLRRGRSSSTLEKKPTKKMPKAVVPVVAKKNGIVSHKKLKKAVVPSVRGKPKGNREHKVAATVGENRPYWHDVAEKYWMK